MFSLQRGPPSTWLSSETVPGNHNKSECKVPISKLICTNCPLKDHNTYAHWGPARQNSTNLIDMVMQDNSVYSCSPGGYLVTATSFLDRAVNIGQIGTNKFNNCPKILITTGAIVLTGIPFPHPTSAIYLTH